MENLEKLTFNRIFLSKDNISISIYEKYKECEEKKEGNISLGKINDFDLKGYVINEKR